MVTWQQKQRSRTAGSTWPVLPLYWLYIETRFGWSVMENNSCARTKSEATVTNVPRPLAYGELSKNLSEAIFINKCRRFKQKYWFDIFNPWKVIIRCTLSQGRKSRRRKKNRNRMTAGSTGVGATGRWEEWATGKGSRDSRSISKKRHRSKWRSRRSAGWSKRGRSTRGGPGAKGESADVGRDDEDGSGREEKRHQRRREINFQQVNVPLSSTPLPRFIQCVKDFLPKNILTILYTYTAKPR
jgi:hypothetical protein